MDFKKIQPRRSVDCTDAVIKVWKEAYPRGVWQISIDTDEEVKTEEKSKRAKKEYEQLRGYFRKPTRTELSASLSTKNAIEQAESLMADCWLGGDEELLSDDDYFQAASFQFSELMAIRTGEIKKL